MNGGGVQATNQSPSSQSRSYIAIQKSVLGGNCMQIRAVGINGAKKGKPARKGSLAPIINRPADCQTKALHRPGTGYDWGADRHLKVRKDREREDSLTEASQGSAGLVDGLSNDKASRKRKNLSRDSRHNRRKSRVRRADKPFTGCCWTYTRRHRFTRMKRQQQTNRRWA